MNVLIRFEVKCSVSKTLPKRMPGVCVTCCVWGMLSDNDVRAMMLSLSTTSPLLFPYFSFLDVIYRRDFLEGANPPFFSF